MLLKNILSKFAVLTLSLFIIVIAGCKRNSIEADNPAGTDTPVIADDAIKVAATISGSVIDENNQPVANTVVTSDTYTGNTDAMGNFVFKNIQRHESNFRPNT
jgi:hypothetical protein